MTTLYFFGDSWTSENCEVEDLYRRGIYKPTKPIKSIPAILAEITGLNYQNFSLSGSSQEHMLYSLFESDAGAGDHVIFSLTAPSRRFFLDDNGHPQSTQHGDRNSINDYNDSWISSGVINEFYQECLCRKAIPWFFCSFNRSRFDSNKILESRWKRIPDKCWLLDPTTCAVAEWLDPKWFSQFEEYMNSDFYDWLKSDSKMVAELIHPCREHPNMEGRWVIAKIIAEKIL